MDTWAGLFRRIERMDPLERRVVAARAEFDRWATGAERRVLADVARVARGRAVEARSHTGISVEVVYRIMEPALGSVGGAHGAVSLSFGGNAVDVYTTRTEGESPNVLLACQRAPTSSRFPVVISLPAFLVVRAGAGYRLLSLPERVPTTLDAEVLRAFTILFGAVQSVSSARNTSLPASGVTFPLLEESFRTIGFSREAPVVHGDTRLPGRRDPAT